MNTFEILEKIKNTDEPDRTRLYRAILKDAVDFEMHGVRVSTPKNETWKQVIVFGIETKLRDDIVVVYSVRGKQVTFMWKEQAKRYLKYTETVEDECPPKLQDYFSNLIKNASIRY